VRDRTWPGIKCPIKYCAYVNIVVKFSGGGGDGGGCRFLRFAAMPHRRHIMSRYSKYFTPLDIVSPIRDATNSNLIRDPSCLRSIEWKDCARKMLQCLGWEKSLLVEVWFEIWLRNSVRREFPLGNLSQMCGKRQGDKISTRYKSRKRGRLVCIKNERSTF